MGHSGMRPGSSEAERVVRRLRSDFPEIDHVPRGCYLVGGCIRDALLDRSALDVDFAAFSAAGIAGRFAARVRSRAIQLGRDALAVWRVTAQDRVYDFAGVVGESIEIDLGRRDFTINALAVELNDVPRLIDPFNGWEDLKSRTIRIVSEKNIEEDPLRILRAVRFAVQLDFEIDPGSFPALAARSGSLASSAPERVTYELDLILCSQQPARGLKLINGLGLSNLLFGLPPDERTISRIDSLQGDPTAALMILLEHLTDRQLEAHGNRWRWSTQMLRDLLDLRRAVEAIDTGGESLAVVLYDAGLATSRRAVKIFQARGLEDQARRVEEVLAARGDSLFALEALLSGHDIQQIAGIEEGAEVGRLKRLLLEAQIRGEITSRDEAVALISRAGS